MFQELATPWGKTAMNRSVPTAPRQSAAFSIALRSWPSPCSAITIGQPFAGSHVRGVTVRYCRCDRPELHVVAHDVDDRGRGGRGPRRATRPRSVAELVVVGRWRQRGRRRARRWCPVASEPRDAPEHHGRDDDDADQDHAVELRLSATDPSDRPPVRHPSGPECSPNCATLRHRALSVRPGSPTRHTLF